MIVARTCGPHGPDMWPGQPGRVARTRGPDGPDMWPERPGHAARTARTCGPTAGVRAVRAFLGWVLRGKCTVGGFGWLMFEEVFGASMALFAFDFLALRGWGGVDG